MSFTKVPATELLDFCRDNKSHFFEPSTMQFFNSRLLESSVHRSDDGRYLFITSERFEEDPRTYRVREMALNKEGHVSTVTLRGEFPTARYLTARQAHAALNRVLAG